MNAIWRALTSLKLAIGLLAVLAVGCILATLVPQGLDAEQYAGIYPRLVAIVVTETGLAHYFTSLLFLLPGIAFFLNLLACAARRLVREARKKTGRRHGPDVLHVGLLVLVVGSLVSFSGRREGSVTLRVGDSLELPGSEILTLRSFTDERYDDGRPKAWTSVVDIARDGRPVVTGRAIRVNAPLRIGSLTLYQASYGSEPEVELRDAEGAVHVLAQGDTWSEGDLAAFFMTVETADSTAPARAVLRVTGVGDEAVVRVGPDGADVGDMRATLRFTPTTGLDAVEDPGFPLVLAGLLLVAAGTALTFARKLKETP